MIPIAYSNKRPTGELLHLYFPSQLFLSRCEVIEIHHVCQGTSWSTLDLVFFTASVRTWHIHPHVMAVMRYKYAEKGAPTNSSGTRSIRPASPRNRKSSSAASTLSWQGPTLPGCLPSQQKIVCPKMWFQGHELAPSAVASQKFPAPTAQLPRNMTISPFHSRPAAPSATSARETFQGWNSIFTIIHDQSRAAWVAFYVDNLKDACIARRIPAGNLHLNGRRTKSGD